MAEAAEDSDGHSEPWSNSGDEGAAAAARQRSDDSGNADDDSSDPDDELPLAERVKRAECAASAASPSRLGGILARIQQRQQRSPEGGAEEEMAMNDEESQDVLQPSGSLEAVLKDCTTSAEKGISDEGTELAQAEGSSIKCSPVGKDGVPAGETAGVPAGETAAFVDAEMGGVPLMSTFVQEVRDSLLARLNTSAFLPPTGEGAYGGAAHQCSILTYPMRPHQESAFVVIASSLSRVRTSRGKFDSIQPDMIVSSAGCEFLCTGLILLHAHAVAACFPLAQLAGVAPSREWQRRPRSRPER